MSMLCFRVGLSFFRSEPTESVGFSLPFKRRTTEEVISQRLSSLNISEAASSYPSGSVQAQCDEADMLSLDEMSDNASDDIERPEK